MGPRGAGLAAIYAYIRGTSRAGSGFSHGISRFGSGAAHVIPFAAKNLLLPRIEIELIMQY